MAGRTPAQQARMDSQKSKSNAVRSLKDMSPEEQAKLIAELENADRSAARRRAEAAKSGKR